jgi:hypothetical protein
VANRVTREKPITISRLLLEVPDRKLLAITRGGIGRRSERVLDVLLYDEVDVGSKWRMPLMMATFEFGERPALTFRGRSLLRSGNSLVLEFQEPLPEEINGEIGGRPPQRE